MHRFCLFLGILAVIFQNMVFWQALLPAKMQQNQVCVQIIQTIDHSMNASHHQMKNHHTMDNSSETIDHNVDCHFCQLFYSSFPIFDATAKLIEIKVVVKTIFLTISLYLFFYLKRLFLGPLSRGPPAIVVFA